MPAEAVPAGQGCRAEGACAARSGKRMQGRHAEPGRGSSRPAMLQGNRRPERALTLHCVDPCALLYWPGAHGSHSSAATTFE